MKKHVFFNKVWMVITICVICILGISPMEGLADGKILFVSTRTGNNDIWIMDEDGSNQQQLTHSPDSEHTPTFSPDGTQIAFVNYTKKKLLIMDVDGSNHRTIYTSTAHQIAYTAWSPDGSKLTFRQGPYNYYDIWVINSDGSNPHNITNDGHHNGRSSWSPDGSKIVYDRRSIPPYSYSVEVWVMNSDGSNKTQLTFGGWCGYTCENVAADWSPDGTRLTYASGAYGHVIGNRMYRWDIYVMNPDGTNKIRLTTDPIQEEFPVWTPDSNRIAFNRNGDIYLINADGTGESRLTFTGGNYVCDWIDMSSDNSPPTADAGEDITITSEVVADTVVNGTASDEDADDNLEYRWKEGETILADWTPAGGNGECPLYLNAISIGIGTHTLTLEVTDGDETASDDMLLTILNSPPNISPNGGGVFEINEVVTLGGYVSDFDGDLLNYQWLEGTTVFFSGTVQTVNGGTLVELPEHTTSTLPLGIHTIALQVDDGANEPVSGEITVEIVDNTPPTLEPAANKTVLRPPNHKMVDIVIQANASDNSGLPVTLNAAIACNEPVNGSGDGDKSPDWTEPVIDQENGIITFQLRAERSGNGNGRVYTITITATDTSYNTTTANIEITVPHDKKKK
ncbi:MAG: hypothetical protein GY950_16060 [bacterium]|nr:hypothetical protein [bacterium]